MNYELLEKYTLGKESLNPLIKQIKVKIKAFNPETDNKIGADNFCPYFKKLNS